MNLLYRFSHYLEKFSICPNKNPCHSSRLIRHRVLDVIKVFELECSRRDLSRSPLCFATISLSHLSNPSLNARVETCLGSPLCFIAISLSPLKSLFECVR